MSLEIKSDGVDLIPHILLELESNSSIRRKLYFFLRYNGLKYECP